jgi:hypothetical protein
VGVLAYAFEMLDVGGIGAGKKHSLGGLEKLYFAVRRPIEANYVGNGSPSHKQV